MFGLSELIWGWICAGVLCLLIVMGSTIAVQHAHNVTMSGQLTVAQGNEAANKKSADSWQKVATDSNTACELYKAQQTLISSNNASALAAAEKSAAVSNAKLKTFSTKYSKALLGPAGPLLNTKIPIEALP